jgi:hypothetical protein
MITSTGSTRLLRLRPLRSVVCPAFARARVESEQQRQSEQQQQPEQLQAGGVVLELGKVVPFDLRRW